MSKKLVQCFYNVTYNEGSYAGQSQCCYGFMWLDLLSEDKLELSNQVQIHLMNIGSVEKGTKFYNFNVNSLTPFPVNSFEEVGEEIVKLPLWSDDVDIDVILDQLSEGFYTTDGIQSVIVRLAEDIQCLKESLSEKS